MCTITVERRQLAWLVGYWLLPHGANEPTLVGEATFLSLADVTGAIHMWILKGIATDLAKSDPDAEVVEAIERLRHEVLVTAEPESGFSRDIIKVCDALEAARQGNKHHPSCTDLVWQK